MSRILAALAALWIFGGVWSGAGAMAQDFSALARVDAGASRIADLPKGRMEIALSLSQGVPWRIFTLTEPDRVVLDFREIDWDGLDLDALVRSERVLAARAGTYRPGLTRLVLALDGPMEVRTAGLSVDEGSGRAMLDVRLLPTTPELFAATAGAPHDPLWDLPAPAPVAPPRERGPDAPMLVVLDPGHGGIDPGAEQDGMVEKDLMLTFAREIRETLLRAGGFEVILTREDDVFVSLERRVAIAHAAQADVFISLHADSLAEGHAHGATVYVLSDESSDKASELLAQRHERDEILSGVDLSQADDEVTDILLDLARQETRPRTRALARQLVTEMTQKGGPMNRRPLRLAGFSVLKAADIPSVLVEIGFLSSPRDLDNLRNPRWRASMAEAIRAGLQAWAVADAAQKNLVRQ
ncbi:MAG: N-acetylmuramoyl-L-alanine amidase [Pseudooceanicola nanhaiensis]|uniref:N-acetylmuramoyl-L-alanine amidase n=1 Tax=Marinibacterium profundimaris TaxID=1679460 RepID=A0A225NQ38_9RHOB|nr:N-acetylmuramoyl-L-alanine amidase [Marinibacterium profundimaris]OWU74881.1 N-acetylmuramoyl-L-alanine amidase [Marinibacterium profundimaris]